MFSPNASATKPSTARIVRDIFLNKKFRTFCYEARGIACKVFGLSRIDRYPFVRLLYKDSLRFMLGNVQPIRGQTLERAKAAAGWLLRAQGATADDGVSYGYFPYGSGNGWRTSYPETTGYIISTLLKYTNNTGDKQFAEAALRMAHWEISVQMKSGAVQANALCAPEEQVAAAFNTGTCSTTLKFAGATFPTLTTSASAIDTLSYSCRSATYCYAALSKGYNP